MKKKIDSRAVELSHILNEINKNAINLNSEANPLFAAQVMHQRREPSPPKPQFVAQTFEQETKREMPSPAPLIEQKSVEKKISKTSAKKKSVKSVKKRKSKRLKSRKSPKKYKGNCPRF